MPKFGRLQSFDARSRNFGVREIVRGLEPITKTWECDKVMDQGSQGSCVGHGIGHELIATPVPCPSVDHDYAYMIYKEAQKVDDWEGEDYEGTSVIAGLKVIKSIGWCDEFRWSFSHLDTQLGIAYEGPGIAGTNWYTGMMNVDSEGFIHPTGYNEGGHCYLFLGVDQEKQAFIIHNSWGEGWGRGGRAFLSFEDYEKLRQAEGEMAFLIGRHEVGTEPVPPEPEPSDCEFSNSVAGLLNSVWKATGKRTRFYTKVERG